MWLYVWHVWRYIGLWSKQYYRCLQHSWKVFILCHSLICFGSEPFRPKEQLLSTEDEIFLVTMARSSNKAYAPLGNSIYHFTASLVRVRWNSLKQIESSCKELEEHQRWKVVTCSSGSSPALPSNLGMFERSLVGTVGHTGSWDTGSFINIDKSGKFNFARKGRLGWAGQFHAPW